METLADIAERVEQAENTMYVFLTTVVNLDGDLHMGELHTNVFDNSLVVDMLRQLATQIETKAVVFDESVIPH